MVGKRSELFLSGFQKLSLVTAACFLPGRAKDLSAPRYMKPKAQVRTSILRNCELQNSHGQEHTLDLVEIPEQSALEEAEAPESEPKERTMTVFSLTETLRLAEAGIRVFEDVDWNEKRVATNGQGAVCLLACCEEVLKKLSVSRQTSVFDFCKSSSRTCASPPVLLDIDYDDTDDPPTVKQEVLCPSAVISLSSHFLNFFVSINIYFCFFVKIDFPEPPFSL